MVNKVLLWVGTPNFYGAFSALFFLLALFLGVAGKMGSAVFTVAGALLFALWEIAGLIRERL